MSSEPEVMPSGYSREEEHFFRRDQELIRKKRSELDEQRKKREAESRKHPHWMKCPKCGKDLQEIEMDGVMVDRCTGCNGLYFDAGELEIMLSTHRTWKQAVKKMLGR